MSTGEGIEDLLRTELPQVENAARMEVGRVQEGLSPARLLLPEARALVAAELEYLPVVTPHYGRFEAIGLKQHRERLVNFIRAVDALLGPPGTDSTVIGEAQEPPEGAPL